MLGDKSEKLAIVGMELNVRGSGQYTRASTCLVVMVQWYVSIVGLSHELWI